MPRLVPDADDVTAYLVVEDFGPCGRAFVETDLGEADRGTIVWNLISGQYRDALRVVAFNTAEGWSRDVSEDIAGEVVDGARTAGATLNEGTRRFVDRYLDSGERRPPAPSVRRGERERKKLG
jgi:hypothetical protein